MSAFASVNHRVARLLEVRGISIAELAKGTGLSPDRLLRIVQGALLPKQDEIGTIAKYLNVPWLYLSGDITSSALDNIFAENELDNDLIDIVNVLFITGPAFIGDCVRQPEAAYKALEAAFIAYLKESEQSYLAQYL